MAEVAALRDDAAPGRVRHVLLGLSRERGSGQARGGREAALSLCAGPEHQLRTSRTVLQAKIYTRLPAFSPAYDRHYPRTCRVGPDELGDFQIVLEYFKIIFIGIAALKPGFKQLSQENAERTLSVWKSCDYLLQTLFDNVSHPGSFFITLRKRAKALSIRAHAPQQDPTVLPHIWIGIKFVGVPDGNLLRFRSVRVQSGYQLILKEVASFVAFPPGQFVGTDRVLIALDRLIHVAKLFVINPLVRLLFGLPSPTR